MSNRTTKMLLTLSALLFAASACNSQPAQIEPQRSQPAPTQIIEPVVTPSAQPTQSTESTQLPRHLPSTENEVPRVSVEDAKAALDSGKAIILDVRSPAAFEMSHIAGALSIPLANIETNSAGLNLDQDQWIITYCT